MLSQVKERLLNLVFPLPKEEAQMSLGISHATYTIFSGALPIYLPGYEKHFLL